MGIAPEPNADTDRNTSWQAEAPDAAFTLRPAHEYTDGKGETWRIPPGLKRALPFYLHKPWARLGRPLRLFEYMARNLGPISHYRLFNIHVVYLNDPSFVREVLINQAGSFVRERTIKRLKILLGEGLLTSDDPTHKRSRRIAAPAFHRQRIAAYAETMVESARAARDRWHEGQEIDIAATMMSLSLEIVARTLFATEVDADVRAINDETNAIMAIYNYLIAFPNLEAVLHWPIPGVTRFRKARARLDRVINRIIADTRALGEAKLSERTDLLALLLLARDEDGSELSDAQLRDEVITIFLAGYETTANALTWTMYLLTLNPEADRRMHAELREVLGEGAEARLPTLNDYTRLRYTTMVLAEGMRLYPPAWAMGRMNTEPIEIGGYRLPPGTHWYLSQYVLQRSPELYPDPLRFEPLRHTEEEKAKRDKFAYFPFGGGSRQCIGEGFAWMEMVLVLATVAQRWRMELIPGQTVDVEEKITLRPRYPIRVRLRER
ncbi:cytochrome P450 [Terriglobus aquaticus]|uniref:Cytochrome P450 n=1 Tax=Terriglobus aquaticus TaxID=940139 RepID=A0ABW9KJ83_9BACT|nr:cytochrome P450 [Terriglobus aquaticus]